MLLIVNTNTSIHDDSGTILIVDIVVMIMIAYYVHTMYVLVLVLGGRFFHTGPTTSFSGR